MLFQKYKHLIYRVLAAKEVFLLVTGGHGGIQRRIEKMQCFSKSSAMYQEDSMVNG